MKQWNKSHQDWKDQMKSSYFGVCISLEEEMEISSFPQQSAWDELWEAKVLEHILYVNIGKVKGVIFSLN